MTFSFEFTLLELVLLVGPMLLIEGFYAGAEIALLSADRLQLKKLVKAQQSTGASLALDLLKHPQQIFSTTLLMTSICVIMTSILVAIYVRQSITAYSELVSIIVTSPLVIFFGELIPKTIYQRFATRFAPWLSRPVYYTYFVFYPVTRLLSKYTHDIVKIVKPLEVLITGKKRTTRDDLRSLLSYSKKETELKNTEKRMIKRIFDFSETEVKHALIPLVRVHAIEQGAPIREALERFRQHRHSRMPVFSKRVDNIIGVLEIFEIFSVVDLNLPIDQFVKPAHYAAESQVLEDLILEMAQKDSEMAVVVDEHGGAVGVLTYEDIFEEVVGEIRDEYDKDHQYIRKADENEWIVDARIEVDELAERLKLDITLGGYKTLSGFLLEQFGRIPKKGDELLLDFKGGITVKFTIRDATEKHIDLVVIEKTYADS